MPELFFGYVPNPEATEAFCATLPPVYGEQIADVVAKDENEDALNYRALTACLIRQGLKHKLKDRDGKPCIVSTQQGSIGSCVGNAEARDLDALAAIEIELGGESEFFKTTFSPDGLYGLGREIGNMLGPRDGLYGSAIAKAVREWGTLHQMPYDSVDLSTYTVERCRKYGRYGVGDALKQIAKEHLCVHAARVNSGDEGWSLIGSGYTINQCSNIGWQGDRDSEGIIKRSGSWAHSMAATSRRTTSGGNRIVLIHNSWGNDWAKGPYWEDMPWGSFWISLSDFDAAIRQNDSFAHAKYDGFMARTLPPDLGAAAFLG